MPTARNVKSTHGVKKAPFTVRSATVTLTAASHFSAMYVNQSIHQSSSRAQPVNVNASPESVVKNAIVASQGSTSSRRVAAVTAVAMKRVVRIILRGAMPLTVRASAKSRSRDNRWVID